ncbi:MAG TPA: hypothetical protein VMV70_08955 [Gallionella sp.]|nr:hypothetical protein [Gallionella sp.]
MNGPELLEQHVGKLVTSAGGFIPGERAIFRGQNLHTSLKDLDWLELYLFGITGHRYSKPQMKLLHAICTFTSYPDTRLWNNRVAALAGSTRSTGTLGIAAAFAVSEAKIYGWGVVLRASEFLTRARIAVDAGADLNALVRAELKQQRGIGGYGRPIVSADERIAPLIAIAEETGFNTGPYINLAFEVEKILLEGRFRLRMNYAALAAALCADQGMSPHEYYFSSMPSFLAGMPPCYLDAVENPEGQLFPLPCRMLSYEGVPHRRWHAANPAVQADE